jgi:endonuclease YncB( thermonuclease family)
MRPALFACLFTPLLVLIPAVGLPATAAQELEVKVVAVADGDTITVLDSNNLKHRIRLAGIDAPEKGQPFSERSTQALSRLVHGRAVRIQWSKTDAYGRFVAKVLVDGGDVNLAQVDAGLAWHYKQFEKEQSASDRKAYAAAEHQARTRHTGIWSQPDPVPPWDRRHGVAGGEVRKSRNDICHAPGMPSYSSVKKFEAFATLEDCIKSGGRPPRGNSATT